MNKPAPTNHAIHPLLQQRWSPRALSAAPVTEDALLCLFEAARWAASASNEQPWRFVIAHHQNKAAFQKLWECLKPGNQPWAKHAGALVLTATRRTLASSGAPNRHSFHDVGLAVGQLVIQAGALGLFVHQMAGFEQDKARAAFGVPEDHDLVTVLAIGGAGALEQLTDQQRERELAPRTRLPLIQVAFYGAWEREWAAAK